MTILDCTVQGTGWTEIVTPVAAEADAEIHKHLDCSGVDSESITFYCYTHNVSVRWIG